MHMPLKTRKKPGDDRIKLIKGWTSNPEIVLGILDRHERAKKAKRMKEWRSRKKDRPDD